jgi:DNA-binding response OmpR family regulator
MQSPPQILLIGHEPSLMDTRRWLLQGRGFRVLLAARVTDASQILSSHDIDLLILCHSLSVKDLTHAIRMAQSIRPQMKRLILQSTDISHTVAALEEREQVLEPLEGPQAFLRKVTTMLNIPDSGEPHLLMRLK